ncbi:hypothetical protein [Halochromatium roseum]|uniref:hypothetical protein n=1 Tax=Halochromatium roseum TaxID=391920 RepID=UPI001914A510|nr:hypothetical protein [Halochromatium roseum]MBK5940436.1 hypothetical protein [Halochromatium roseum]
MPRALTPIIRPVGLLVLGAILGGCGGTLVAPEGPASNAFLDKVDERCGKLSVGGQPISYLLDVDSNDTTFLDETAKLGAGMIDGQTYVNDLNSFYPTGNNQAAMRCILGLVDEG